MPRADADMSVFERTQRETTCPYKGVANYFSLKAGSDADANAVWTYETPKAGVAEIKDFLAFYPDKVEIARTAAEGCNRRSAEQAHADCDDSSSVMKLFRA